MARAAVTAAVIGSARAKSISATKAGSTSGGYSRHLTLLRWYRPVSERVPSSGSTRRMLAAALGPSPRLFIRSGSANHNKPGARTAVLDEKAAVEEASGLGGAAQRAAGTSRGTMSAMTQETLSGPPPALTDSI